MKKRGPHFGRASRPVRAQTMSLTAAEIAAVKEARGNIRFSKTQADGQPHENDLYIAWGQYRKGRRYL